MKYPFDELISVEATQYDNTQRLTALVDALFTLENEHDGEGNVEEYAVVKVGPCFTTAVMLSGVHSSVVAQI